MNRVMPYVTLVREEGFIMGKKGAKNIQIQKCHSHRECKFD